MTLMLIAGTITGMVTRIGSKRRQHLYMKQWREKFDLTVEDVAGRLNLSRTTVWRWENEQHRLNPEKIARYAHALDIEPEQLWRLPERPSADALLKDASKEDLDTVIDVVERILRGKAS